MEYVNIDVETILSAIQYKKGNRVIVNFNTAKDPEYYVGTVTTIRKGIVYVIFDDGDKGSYKPTASKVGLVGITKKKIGRKSEIPAKDINKWLSIDIGKASPKRKTKPNVVEKKTKKLSKNICFDWFEKFLFGDQFNKKEKNTSDEDRLWDIIEQFTTERFSNKKKFTESFRKLKECKTYYKDLLTPKSKVMYRGLTLKPNIFKKLIESKYKLLKKNNNKSASNSELTLFKGIYKPTSELQSWTTDLGIASSFASGRRDYIEEGTVKNIKGYLNYLESLLEISNSSKPCVIKVTTDESFFGTPELTNKISELSEKEVWRLGGSIKCEFLLGGVDLFM